MSYNKDGSIRKPGSGRPKGAKSLAVVRFGDLKRFLSDDSQIAVGRKFLETIGFIELQRQVPILGTDDKIKVETETFDFKTRKWKK